MENTYQTILIEYDNSIAYIYLNRPEVHNAINNTMIDELNLALESLENNKDIRVIVLSGKGQSFCAGADLLWMKSVINYSFEENFGESMKLAALLKYMQIHSKPIIAMVNGSAIGGGAGIMCACDIVIASLYAKIGFSEVKLGIVPAVISPYVISRIGNTMTKELFLTGRISNAFQVESFGLVNLSVQPSALKRTVQEYATMIIKNGPQALQKAKELIFNINRMQYPEIQDYTARMISELRISDEGQEGMNAFFEKRKPSWIID